MKKKKVIDDLRFQLAKQSEVIEELRKQLDMEKKLASALYKLRVISQDYEDLNKKMTSLASAENVVRNAFHNQKALIEKIHEIVYPSTLGLPINFTSVITEIRKLLP